MNLNVVVRETTSSFVHPNADLNETFWVKTTRRADVLLSVSVQAASAGNVPDPRTRSVTRLTPSPNPTAAAAHTMEDVYSSFLLYGAVFVRPDEEGMFNRSVPLTEPLTIGVTVKEWEAPRGVFSGPVAPGGRRHKHRTPAEPTAQEITTVKQALTG